MVRLPILQVQLRMPVSELVEKDGSKRYAAVCLCSLQGTAAAARLTESDAAAFVGGACSVVLGATVRQLTRQAVCPSECSCMFVCVKAAGGELGNMFACVLHVRSYLSCCDVGKMLDQMHTVCDVKCTRCKM